MSPPAPASHVRADLLSGGRACWGLALLFAPDRLAAAVDGRAPSSRVRAVIRLLGGRELAEALLVARYPRPWALRTAAAVDATHGASMVLLAVCDSRFRPLAATSALVSSLLAALSAREAVRSSRQ